jgi:hypothetical protein
MLFMELIALYYEYHTKPINILYNADCVTVKAGYTLQCHSERFIKKSHFSVHIDRKT